MGRRLRQLDPAEGPVERFAHELRELRSHAGDPPFWKMARRSAVSKTALAAAAGGRVLPTERVLQEFVAVCGGDWPWWRSRLLSARDELASQGAQDCSAPSPSGRAELVLYGTTAPEIAPYTRDSAQLSSRTPRGRNYRPRRRGKAAAIISVAAVTAAALTYFAVNGTWSSPGTPGAQAVPAPAVTARSDPSATALAVNDGDDPRTDGCASANDLENADLGSLHDPFVPILDRHGHVIGDLGIWRNARCAATWPEASYDNPGLYKTTLTLYRPADGAAVSVEVIENLPDDAVIGRLLRAGKGCVRAEIQVDVPDAPPVTARTPCET